MHRVYRSGHAAWVASLQLPRDVTEKVAVTPSQTILVVAQSRRRRAARGIGPCIERGDDLPHFPLQRGKVRVVSIAQINVLFSTGFDKRQ